MNNKGQALMVGVMLAAAIIVTLLGIIGIVSQVSGDAQSAMQCTNVSISDYTKAGCWVTDISTPYFFAIILGLAGVALLAKYYAE